MCAVSGVLAHRLARKHTVPQFPKRDGFTGGPAIVADRLRFVFRKRFGRGLARRPEVYVADVSNGYAIGD